MDDQPDDRLAELHDELTLITAMPVWAEIIGLALFGGTSPRLLAGEINHTQPLAGLHKAVHKAVRNAGISLRQSTRFRPHITVTRFAATLSPVQSAQLAGFVEENQAFHADPVLCDCMTVYRSELTPQGPVYTPLAEYALAGHY